MTNGVYRVNIPRVIFENIDGELILVHMERGTYYSTDQVGADIWSMIETQCNLAEMCEALQSKYDAGPEEIAGAVSTFLSRLAAEDLVSVGPSSSERATPVRVPSEGRRPFRPPALESYRDMQDMLSLDPVHDVEAAGWPVPKMDDDSPRESKSA